MAGECGNRSSLQTPLTQCFRHYYKPVSPHSIPLYSLVEIQVAFTAVKVKQQEYQFIPKLRSVCILDRSVEHVSNLFEYPRVGLIIHRIVLQLQSKC